MSSKINPATALTDRVNAAPRQNVGGRLMVDLDEVLAIVANAVPVEVDLEMYSEVLPSVTDEQRETLALISTVYNLLADKAAEFADRDIRAQAERLGVEMVSTAEVFAKNKDNPDPSAVESYHDLAPRNSDRVEDLGRIFEALVDESTREAAMGLVVSMSSTAAMDGLLAELHKGLDL